MKIAALLLTFILTAPYEAAIPYFSRARTVTVPSPDHQNYFIVDAGIWKFARPDLGDLRLYDAQLSVPYALAKQSGGSSTRESPAPVLNLGKAGDHTEFDLDVRGLNPYERVRLEIDAKNFINNARVQGSSSLNHRAGIDLGRSTLYDFTSEGLGSNFLLKFPASSFPYLHVQLSPGISPRQIKSAYISNFSETKSARTQAGNCTSALAPAMQSAFNCLLWEGMPLDRLAFDLPPGAVNFNRTVIVSDGKGNELERASISRVRIDRAGQTVVADNVALNLYSRVAKQVKITVENGDDPPLPIQQLRPLSIERRVYFDPNRRSALHLYYGDARLDAPSYDYQKFFQPLPEAVMAQLGADEANPQFTGRPDDRPWSERHNALLWIAMLSAVALLGGLALRGLRSTSAPGTN